MFLPFSLLPAGAAIALVLIAVAPVAAGEAMQAAVVLAVVTESETGAGDQACQHQIPGRVPAARSLIQRPHRSAIGMS